MQSWMRWACKIPRRYRHFVPQMITTIYTYMHISGGLALCWAPDTFRNNFIRFSHSRPRPLKIDGTIMMIVGRFGLSCIQIQTHTYNLDSGHESRLINQHHYCPEPWACRPIHPITIQHWHIYTKWAINGCTDWIVRLSIWRSARTSAITIIFMNLLIYIRIPRSDCAYHTA